ncbi:protein of unknown function [Blastococcus saxobsidens DD2]|uniref:Uncharacterized protein n=1 Tax=Blastococcus saxobsidens (strain DD2) TaxID=1146883 RepID=H6RT44_BLASD|nr:protein of unknown function [Blastococcus saxobsidens DD2]
MDGSPYRSRQSFHRRLASPTFGDLQGAARRHR